MDASVRIGYYVVPADPFYVQVATAIVQAAQQLPISLVVLDDGIAESRPDEYERIVEALHAQDLAALIVHFVPDALMVRLLDGGWPVIHLVERGLPPHPRYVAPRGLYASAQLAGNELLRRMHEPYRLLVAGNLALNSGRLAGIRDLVTTVPHVAFQAIQTGWTYTEAYQDALRELGRRETPFQAVFGFSDPIALAVREAALALGLIDERTPVAGINGDPLALAAVAEGRMAATVETAPHLLGQQAVELALQAARGQPLPASYSFQPRLVTAANVTDVAVQKLIAIADIPSQLVGVNRQREQVRLTQLETSLEITQQVGAILDRQTIACTIADLIATRLGYDSVVLWRWHATDEQLVRETDSADVPTLRMDAPGPLSATLLGAETVLLPDAQRSDRFPPDPVWPTTRTRVIVPIRVGGILLGLIDLHSVSLRQHNRHELLALQVLADQLGVAIRNAELYAEAVVARQRAEQADQLKTRLLANVSHELRTPLNLILGYSQMALSSPSPYAIELPPSLRSDLGHIHRSGTHLLRLINDLLDLAQAEIDQLALFYETIHLADMLPDIFASMAGTAKGKSTVRWRLELAADLPPLYADAVRLRQIVLNLLANAQQWTEAGTITLGADVQPPYLHLWVADSGSGIAPDMQAQIFEPFVTAGRSGASQHGVGLGLTITRRLVRLHGGMLTLESQLDCGSTFHVYLPLGQAHEMPAQPTALPANTSIQLKPLPAAALTEVVQLLAPTPTTPREQPILIVDDDCATCTFYQQVLARTYPERSVQIALGGAAALALLEHLSPALVILDLAMPDVDGFQVLDAIRAHPRIRSVPVVVLSGQRLNDADLRRLDQQRLTFQSKGIWRDSEFANEIERAVSASERPAAQTGSLVRLAVAFMQQHYTRPLNRSEIAAAVGVHKDYLSQIFRQELGITAWDYLNRYRIERAKELLCGSTTSITSIATHVGFEDVSYFGRVFRREVGCSAATYREQATEYQP